MTNQTDTMKAQAETSAALTKARTAFRKLLVGSVAKKTEEIRAWEDKIAKLENIGQQDIAKHAFIYITAAKAFNATLLESQEEQKIKTGQASVVAEMKTLSNAKDRPASFGKLLRRGIRQACLCIEEDTVKAGFVMAVDTKGIPTGKVSAPQNAHVFSKFEPETCEETGKTVSVEVKNTCEDVKTLATNNVDDVWKHYYPATKGADQNKKDKSNDATDQQNPESLGTFMALAEFITGKSTGTVANISRLSKPELQAVLAAIEVANVAQMQGSANGEDNAGSYVRALIDGRKAQALDSVAA